jgi:hypothetical protein
MIRLITALVLGCLVPTTRSRPMPGPGHPHPVAAPTIGFFLDDWTPKQFTAPPTQQTEKPTITNTTPTLTIDSDSTITAIPPAIFGHNVDTWMAKPAYEPFLNNLSNLHAHILRWPAGSGSDAYFWNSGPDNLPAGVPTQITNKDGKKEAPHWFYGRPKAGITSIDDYYALLETTHNEGLITVNYGYARYGTSADPVAAAAHLAADWVRYDHGRTKYWEIGNENNGTWEYGYRIDTTEAHNGQPRILTGECYGKHFRVFADSMRKAASEVGAHIYIGAVTTETAPHPWDFPIMTRWNAGMMPNTRDCADYYVVHNYFTPYNKNSTANEILYAATTVPGDILRYVTQACRDNGVPIKPVAMDEWNMFAVGSKQQVSNISGLFGVIVLGEALRNKYGLAARWDLSNGWANGNDHGLFSAGDEPGMLRWSPRPSFYYLYYLQRFMGDRLVQSTLTGDTTIKAYTSIFSSGEIGAALVNRGTAPVTIKLAPRHFRPGGKYYWYTLNGDGEEEFARKVQINGHSTAAVAGGPNDYAAIPAFSAPAGKDIAVTIPGRGAVFMVIESKRMALTQ